MLKSVFVQKKKVVKYCYIVAREQDGDRYYREGEREKEKEKLLLGVNE